MFWLTALVALALCGSSAPSQSTSTLPAPAVVRAPAGMENVGVEWRRIEIREGGTILMAVARPAGPGPFPAVVILHGSHGFAREYVQLAKELAENGVVAVAPCWFAPGSGPGRRFVSPVKCPAATPPMADHHSQRANQTVESIVQAVRALPSVRSDQIALFGHSRGGGATWNFLLKGGDAQALILNSAGYPDEVIRRAGEFNAPLLILHGERDGPGDPSGGGAMTDVRRARAFQDALRNAGKPVDAVYYPTGQHNSLWTDPAQHADEVQHMKSFLNRHLRGN